jgi:hypothetical protein
MMTDEPASNIWDTARFLKLSADMEHDDPEQAPAFKRDQQLTDAALFKAKVLAVLDDEANKWSYVGTARTALDRAAGIIRDIQP